MITLALFVVGLILAAIEDIRSRGQSILAWAVVCIALGLVLGRVDL